MLALVAALVSAFGLSELLPFVRVEAEAPLTSGRYRELPFVALLGKRESAGFFAPLSAALEARRSASAPAACPSDAGDAVSVTIDVAHWLGQVARARGGSSPDVRLLSALGLARADAFGACVDRRGFSAWLDGKHFDGVLGTLDSEATASRRPPRDHYWYLRLAVLWPDAWAAAKGVDRALTGMRGTRLDAALLALSALMDADAESALITPLTGRFAWGLLYDQKSRAAARVAEVEASSTTGLQDIARILDAHVPHAELGRKRRANEWGFYGAMPGFAGAGTFFLRIDPGRLSLAEAAFALDALKDALKDTPKDKGDRALQAWLAPAALVSTIDWARYRALYERVGASSDVQDAVRELGIAAWVEQKSPPPPRVFFTGFDRLTVRVRRGAGPSGGERLFIDAASF